MANELMRDVVIFGGQSNMQGQSEALSESEPVEGALEYKFLTDSLVPLRNPVGENIRNDGTAGEPITPSTNLGQWLAAHALGAACYGHTNLVPAFCRACCAVTKTPIAAVHAAKGSTLVSDWLPGTVGGEALVKKSAAAIECVRRAGGVRSVSLVWLQGESDAIVSRSCAEYKKFLYQLRDSLVERIGLERFGIIRVGRFVGGTRDEEIMRAQSEACAEDPGFLMLTESAASMWDIPRYMHPAIGGHFSAAGLEQLGCEAGEMLGCALRT